MEQLVDVSLWYILRWSILYCAYLHGSFSGPVIGSRWASGCHLLCRLSDDDQCVLSFFCPRLVVRNGSAFGCVWVRVRVSARARARDCVRCLGLAMAFQLLQRWRRLVPPGPVADDVHHRLSGALVCESDIPLSTTHRCRCHATTSLTKAFVLTRPIFYKKLFRRIRSWRRSNVSIWWLNGLLWDCLRQTFCEIVGVIFLL